MRKRLSKLSDFLKKVDSGIDPNLIRRADEDFFRQISPVEYAKCLELLFLAKVPIENIRSNHKKYTLLVGDQLHKLWASLDHSHPLRRILAEHEIYYCILSDLEKISKNIQNLTIINSQMSEIRQLAHLIQDLAGIEQHSEYEQDIIYPELVKRGMLQLIRSMNTDNMYLKVSIGNLIRLLEATDQSSASDFKSKLKISANYLSTLIRNHLFIENYILYPFALEYIDNENVWEHIKNMCQEIGYCGIHSSIL
jgi:DUF438 domain-containing protein